MAVKRPAKAGGKKSAAPVERQEPAVVEAPPAAPPEPPVAAQATVAAPATAAEEEAMAARERIAVQRDIATAEREAATAHRETALAEREAAMARREAGVAARESEVAQRERAATDLNREIDAVRQGAAHDAAGFEQRLADLDRRERELEGRAKALDERDDDLAIREAAVEEALSLAAEAGETRSPQIADGDELFLEGPDIPVAPVGAPFAASAPAPAAAAMGAEAEARIAAETQRLAEERAQFDERKKEDERKASEERKRVLDEGGAFLDLLRAISPLEPLFERVQKAVGPTLNATVLLAFYNMAVRQLADLLRAAPSEDKVAALEGTIHERQKALEDALERYVTLKEDFDRYRTRVKNEQDSLTTRAGEDVLRQIVPVLDNFERATAAASGSSNLEAILSGVKMIQRQFEDVLTSSGMVPVKAVGLPFDPKVHEALLEVAVDGVADETVVEEIQRGYTLGGKLFRPALVKIARGGAMSSAPPSPDA